MAVIYQRIKKIFYWPQMKKGIQQFVAACAICQQAKSEKVPYPGLLQPLAVPTQAWHTVSLDFIEGLPLSSNCNCILVVVDKFSKYSHFIKLSHPFTTLKVAKLFLDNIYKLHGMPATIISDRDKIFTSQLWQELFKLSGTELRMSSAYHPQSDGQTERVNQSVEAYLRCFIQACPSKWADWLTLAEFWYNANFHSSLNMSPFQVLYGHEPKHFGIEGVDSCALPYLEVWLKEREQMTELLRQQLLRVQQRMKSQADKHHSERNFEVGDQVWLKLQPYVQTSVASRTNHKLAFRYFGPYEVIKKVGTVAYELKLPPNSKVHLVFHVSLLKKATCTLSYPVSRLPDDTATVKTPELLLNKRLKNKNNRVITQVLVKWEGLPAELATWENEDDIQHQLSEAAARGRAVKLGGEDVMIKRLPGDEEKVSRPSGEKKPSVKISGPEWV